MTWNFDLIRACLGISGMKGNEGYWGGGISIITQNFPKSPSILFHPLQSSISQTKPKKVAALCCSEARDVMVSTGVVTEKSSELYYQRLILSTCKIPKVHC
jgi:hypothetical protein